MTHRLSPILALAAALLPAPVLWAAPVPPATPPAAAPAAATAVADAIRAAYAEMAAGYANNDGAAVFRYQAHDIAVTDPAGTTQDSQQQAQVRRLIVFLITTAKGALGTADVQSVDVQGDTATAVVKEHESLTTAGDGAQSHHFVNDETVRDYWVRAPIGWQIKRARVLTMTTTMDGSPLTGMPALPPGAPVP